MQLAHNGGDASRSWEETRTTVSSRLISQTQSKARPKPLLFKKATNTLLFQTPARNIQTEEKWIEAKVRRVRKTTRSVIQRPRSYFLFSLPKALQQAPRHKKEKKKRTPKEAEGSHRTSQTPQRTDEAGSSRSPQRKHPRWQQSALTK